VSGGKECMDRLREGGVNLGKIIINSVFINVYLENAYLFLGITMVYIKDP
jgi:hypothetical protein